MPNAIDCSAFAPNTAVREKLRARLGLSGQYVIGHVGRFHYAKNHEYLLRVFAALCESGKRSYRLMLLGEGSGMEDSKRLAAGLGIADRVLFLGNRSNIADYYQVMDYFVYPSRYEGLPGTVVEAQTCGLRCLISDTICREVMATGLVHAMSIEDDPANWADYVEKTADYDRVSHVEQMRAAGFDVNGQAERMTEFYLTGKPVQ